MFPISWIIDILPVFLVHTQHSYTLHHGGKMPWVRGWHRATPDIAWKCLPRNFTCTFVLRNSQKCASGAYDIQNLPVSRGLHVIAVTDPGQDPGVRALIGFRDINVGTQTVYRLKWFNQAFIYLSSISCNAKCGNGTFKQTSFKLSCIYWKIYILKKLYHLLMYSTFYLALKRYDEITFHFWLPKFGTNSRLCGC